MKTSLAPRSFARKAQRGISLIQVLVAISVGGLFTYIAVVYGLDKVNQTKVQNEVTALADLKANVVAYGSRVGTFTAANATSAVLVGQQLFPEGVVNGTAAAPVVSNGWGGSITVAVGTVNTAGDSLVFTSPGYPEQACAVLGTSLDSVASRIVIGATVTKAAGGATDPAAVNTACAAGGDNNTIVVTMTR
jgi:type II secretory pathway pseudopilin PulG